MITTVRMLDPIESDESKLILSKTLAAMLNKRPGENIEIIYGARAISAEVDILDSYESYELVPTVGLCRELLLVTNLTYKIRSENASSITIGPVIGLLMSIKVEYLIPKYCTRFVGAYDEVCGLVFCFAYDGIDWTKREVTGFYWASDDKRWVKGTFPLPSSIFRRYLLSYDALNKLHSSIPGDIFNNSQPYNKWVNYTQLKSSSVLRPHLRETALVQELKIIIDLLSQYNSVYVKPSAGEKGQGIIRIDVAENNRFSVKYNSYKEGLIKKQLDSLDELTKFLLELGVGKGRYIVQSTIPLAQYEGCIFDIRVMIQRNGINELVCTGIAGKLAKPQAATSNIASGGTQWHAADLIKKVYDIDDRKANEIIDKCIQLSFDAVKCLENKYGPLGDIGVDIGLDVEGFPWLIECNPVPDHTSVFFGIENRMYAAMSETPLRYASYRAGFPLT